MAAGAGSSSKNLQTSQQLQKLEELFKECKYPDKQLRQKLGVDLGMDPNQIKTWFQNKILQEIEEERVNNEALREENARIHLENMEMSEKLRNRPEYCACVRNEIVEDLIIENALLREERERVASVAVRVFQNPALLRMLGHRIRGLDDEKEAEEDENSELDLELGWSPPLSPNSDDEFDD